MKEEKLQVYNSDSAEEQVDPDHLSIEMQELKLFGWIQWY